MKRVCILTSVHPAFDVRIFHKEAKILVKAGYDVTLIAQHSKSETVDGIKIIALPKPRNRFCRIFFLTRKLYKLALQQRANIYHFHDPELMSWMAKLKKQTRAKIIYDVHEDYSEQILSKYWIPKILRSTIANLFNFYEKRKARKLDYIVTVTPGIKENFQQKNVIEIKNYPVISDYPFQQKRDGLIKDYYELIYVGGLERVRGTQEIIKSLQYINSKYKVKLKLIGEFSEKKFNIEVKKLLEWSKVDFWGYLPQEKAYQNMQNADAGLVCFWPEPNHINAMPNKIFEYMLGGIPVIASNFPLWKELIKGNNCGICVNPLEPREIAKAVEYLIEHPEDARKMGENGRKAVLEKYNWESESKKLLKIYEELTR